MKKLNVLMIVALLAALLLAAAPAGKKLRLTIKNKTQYPVYMQLVGKYTKAYYYLTVPAEEDKTFTVLNDVYKRTTWACDGWKSSGELKMLSQVRLVFTPCNRIPLRKVWRWYRWEDATGQHEFVAEYFMPNFGEPTMEKVWYYQEFSFMKWEKLVDPLIEWGLECEADGTCLFEWSPDGEHWYWLDKFGPGWHSIGHYSLWLPFHLGVTWRTYKGPLGVWWRYQY